MCHDPQTEIDPRADEYAFQHGHYDPPEQGVTMHARPVPKRNPGLKLEDFVYPIGIKFFPPPGHLPFFTITDGHRREEYEYPETSARNARHATGMIRAWASFWSTVTDRGVEVVLHRMDPPGWIKVSIRYR